MPEVFEVVALPGFLGEDVEDAVEVVEHGPSDVTGAVRICGTSFKSSVSFVPIRLRRSTTETTFLSWARPTAAVNSFMR